MCAQMCHCGSQYHANHEYSILRVMLKKTLLAHMFVHSFTSLSLSLPYSLYVVFASIFCLTSLFILFYYSLTGFFN